MTIAIHPLAELLPHLEGAEFAELVASIKANGLREPITTLDNAILDGRNRYRACLEAEVEPRFETFNGGDPFEFVADKNIRRRHLNASQRALIAAKMATMTHGGDRKSATAKIKVGIPTLKAAALLNVNKETVINAKHVLNEATPEEILAVQQGEVAVSTLAQQLRDRVPAEERTSQRTDSKVSGNKRRKQTLRIKGQVWGQLRDALNLLTGLPLPADVASIARGIDKAGLVDARLSKAINWLQEFQNEWNRG